MHLIHHRDSKNSLNDKPGHFRYSCHSNTRQLEANLCTQTIKYQGNVEISAYPRLVPYATEEQSTCKCSLLINEDSFFLENNLRRMRRMILIIPKS